MSKLKEVGFIKKKSIRFYIVNPKYIVNGNENKRRMIIDYYNNDESTAKNDRRFTTAPQNCYVEILKNDSLRYLGESQILKSHTPVFQLFFGEKSPTFVPTIPPKKRGSAKTEPLFIFVKTQYLQGFLTC